MRTVIIVESPTKARKIQSYFKDGTIVRSSFGHIFDLSKKSLSIDVEQDFKPNYQPIPGKERVIKELYSFKNDNILLAADDDREGDAIAWHCGNLMKVDYNKTNRIIFHEISKRSIEEAISQPTKLNMNSVNAQQCRRIIDRLVGFSLSPLLWRHIETDKKGLSAGRVQSTLLSILKDKHEEIDKFQPIFKDDYRSLFLFKNQKIECEFYSYENRKIIPVEFLLLLTNDKEYNVLKLNSVEEKKYAPLPLITSSLQQMGYKELGFSIKKTMDIAQKLYENGKITYMRTDSHSMSYGFQKGLKTHICDTYGENYYKCSFTTKKVKGAQEAHECIRITNINETLSDKYTKDDHKLYNSIKKRTIISHMGPAVYDVLYIQLQNDVIKEYGYFQGSNKRLIFDGYLRYDQELSCKGKQLEIDEDTKFTFISCIYKQKESLQPYYYNESSLIKMLEKSGIGRPSTYSSIVSTLYNRNYTEKKTMKTEDLKIKTMTLDESNKIKESFTIQKSKNQGNCILLTELGENVLRYLLKYFSGIINIEFTSNVEKDLDRIGAGEIEWVEVVRKVYHSFYRDVEIQLKISSNNINKKGSVSINMGLYKDEDVFLKKGPYGYYLNIGDNNINLKNHLLKNKVDAEKIAFNDIKYLLDYPLKMGKYERGEVVIHIGPYGKYMKYKNKNYKIPQRDKYTYDECVRILEK